MSRRLRASPEESETAAENRLLRLRVRGLERENRDLRRSLFHLSLRAAEASAENPAAGQSKPFDIDAAIRRRDDPGAALESVSSSELANQPSAGAPTHRFHHKGDLKGHGSAVYCVKYSPCGRYLASSSSDKTVRLWDASRQEEVSCFQGHTLNVVDFVWSHDSTMVLSGAYDKSVRLWSTETREVVWSCPDLEGLVQSVALQPNDATIAFAGTSKRKLHTLDHRMPKPASTITNETGIVNTMLPSQEEHTILVGDASGYIKSWDLRAAGSHRTEVELRKPVCHIGAPHKDQYEQSRFLTVTCYDNVARVYDRGTMLSTGLHAPLQVVHARRAATFKNFPIRAALFEAADHHVALPRRIETDHGVAVEETKAKDNLILATGSASNTIFLYDLGAGQDEQPMQELHGHSSRVYGVDFHPTQPFLASCSADATIKLWTLKGSRLPYDRP